ncbi:unnamed protein product, partial [Brachionus calyciflorus]
EASWYVCHCGMNSLSEAIHYGKPVVCIPIMYDQPLVSQRLADELKLGIRMDTMKFSSVDLKQSILDVLTDQTYSEKMLIFCKSSRNYNGVQNSINLIENYINQ